MKLYVNSYVCYCRSLSHSWQNSFCRNDVFRDSFSFSKLSLSVCSPPPRVTFMISINHPSRSLCLQKQRYDLPHCHSRIEVSFLRECMHFHIYLIKPLFAALKQSMRIRKITFPYTHLLQGSPLLLP